MAKRQQQTDTDTQPALLKHAHVEAHVANTYPAVLSVPVSCLYQCAHKSKVHQLELKTFLAPQCCGAQANTAVPSLLNS